MRDNEIFHDHDAGSEGDPKSYGISVDGHFALHMLQITPETAACNGN